MYLYFGFLATESNSTVHSVLEWGNSKDVKDDRVYLVTRGFKKVSSDKVGFSGVFAPQSQCRCLHFEVGDKQRWRHFC